MYRPNDRWSVGLSHRAPLDIDYTGDATFTQIPTGYPQFDAIVASQLPPVQDIATTIAYPGLTHFGIATGIIPTWTIELDIVHTSWSRFDRLAVEFADTPALNFEVPENWSDAFSYRLGANHPVTDHWDVRLGALYDESPQPLAGAGPLLPDSDRVGITFGVGYQGRRWSVDVSEMILIFNERDTRGLNKDNFNGVYTTSANLFSVNVGYSF
jgi:long-chain fatty acid transport protein